MKIQLSDRFFHRTSKCVAILGENRRIEKANRAFRLCFGYAKGEETGKSPDFADSSFLSRMWETVERAGMWEGRVWNKRKSGEMFLEKRTLLQSQGKEGMRYVLISEEAGDSQDWIDSSTGLPGVKAFQKAVARELKKAKKTEAKPAVVAVNAERFQVIDQTFGFSEGATLLKAISKRIERIVPQRAALSRMEGGLFALLLSDSEGKAGAGAAAGALLGSFQAEPFYLDGQEVFVSLSIGSCAYPEGGASEKDLLINAESARRSAADAGEYEHRFYAPALDGNVREKLVLETSLRKAMEKKEFFLVYQPQIDVKTSEVVGTEALIRWKHSEKGVVPPLSFIPLAEETGLIVQMGNWVLREACRQNREWQKRGLPFVRVAVNVSLKQFQQDSFADSVREALRETGLSPEFLELEITESMVMKDMKKVTETLWELRKSGVKVSIDDFGTGYSSLSYLARLPVDALKIDRSFIQNVHQNKEDSTIVSMIFAMAHQLRLEVIAEGVETEEHFSYLKKADCDKCQGFYFNPPLAKDEMESLLRKAAKPRKEGE